MYDLAPVGYFTFTSEGLIRETNLKGAELLGIMPQKMINRGFGSFVQSCDLGIWDHYILSLFQEGGKQSCELGT
jgi:PAS domain-containing protein